MFSLYLTVFVDYAVTFTKFLFFRSYVSEGDVRTVAFIFYIFIPFTGTYAKPLEILNHESEQLYSSQFLNSLDSFKSQHSVNDVV